MMSSVKQTAFKLGLLSGTLVGAISAVAAGKTQAPPPAVKAASSGAGDHANQVVRDDDGRIQAGSTGFSMVIPTGWKVRTDVPGLSLVVELPEEKSMKYRSTIQVQVVQGSRYFDSLGISDFQEEITEKLGRAGGSLRDFTVRNAEPVKIDDGRDALLVYTGFNMNGVDLLQAHLLISSADQHVVVTFTDLADNFNSNASDTPLGIAWAAMTTAQLPGKNPERFAGPIQIAALAGVLLVVIGVLLTVRNALARQAYARAGASSDIEAVSSLGAESLDGRDGSNLLPLSGEDLLESGSPVSIEPRQAA